ncbi:MAG: hypothetical protein M3Z48_05460 [Lactobacillus sp.]|nr:hypothetical protein [Lactobacillus sp.]
MEPITCKQERFLKYLVCKAVDYGRRMYIMGNKEGYVVPVLMPKDYDFLVFPEQVTKDEASFLISQLVYAKNNDNDLSKVDQVLADKIYLDENDFTLADFLLGKRIVVGIDLC